MLIVRVALNRLIKMNNPTKFAIVITKTVASEIGDGERMFGEITPVSGIVNVPLLFAV